MLGRRFLILVAVLMGLTALAASVAPRQPVRESSREATPSPTPATGASTLVTVEKSVVIGAGDARVTVNEGDVVELSVSGDFRDSVMVLDRIDVVDPTTPARFSLLAGEPGAYPIELLESGRRVGTLVIRAKD